MSDAGVGDGPADSAQRMQEAMLGLYDLREELREAGFSGELLDQFEQMRVRFMDEFELRYPGYGSGRAVWR